MTMYGDNMTTGGWIFSIAVTLIILGLIVAAIAWPMRSRGTRTGSGESAREILGRRLASGELNDEQYNQLRATLTDGDAAKPNSRSTRRGESVST